VQIRHDDLRRRRVETGQIRGGATKGGGGLLGFQVADVLAEKDLIAHRQRHRVLQMRASGKDAPRSARRVSRWHGQRSETARAAQDHFAIQHHAHDRVVHVTDDRAVVNQEDIRNAPQPVQRLKFIRANRFVAQVAARGDDGKAEFSHQQMMQWIRWQHHAEVGIAGGEGKREVRGRR
jgi:hypothetical protein